jgi:hypothetical protein
MLAGSCVITIALSCGPRSKDNETPGQRLDAALDAVLDTLGLDSVAVDTSVEDAEAGPDPKPTLDTADCVIATGGGYYASISYAGRTADDLSRGSAVICGSDVIGTPPPGFTCFTQKLLVKDGAVAAYCGTKPGITARFLMPPTL